MSFKDYIKERWMTYGFILFAFLFAAVVYFLDNSFQIRESNAGYISTWWCLIFIIFVFFDYRTLKRRVKSFEEYCRLNTSSHEPDDFAYPMDLYHGKMVSLLAAENQAYKAEIERKSAEEMEFITKWLHDVKVPISAAKLILENYETELPGKFYQDLYTELFSIEESIQRVFYELKSNRFSDDFKISKVSTKKLIAQALKGYSNFFSYKRIGISLEGKSCEIITDEKWSGYILSQLISNAVKYTPDEGNIIITTTPGELATTISVYNTGRGILEADIGQVFQKGYTSSENRAGAKATGYGLYLSKRIADLLGIKLTVQSKYNEHAMFTLTFFEDTNLHQVTKM
ncbi:sensor histidine kinase [Sinanaerobacter chloroacetimidivorans]|uniref:histidine kinase n=1 Tax=Sinanaerobacter chloroacetimidivorans TaxID=2818044 RepID=A0A8J7W7C5_9FIRM|nr:sensor histidine kinase [Sinanaerobacter chloroacetimidivorans]MBR0600393.1 sensor histidine kinase [Sinanaerobacter chloroacetimidivorans]